MRYKYTLFILLFITSTITSLYAMDCGVNDAFLWKYTREDIDRRLDIIQESGVKWIRVSFSWKEIQPRENTFAFNIENYADFDYMVSKAYDHNLKILGILGAGNTNLTPPIYDPSQNWDNIQGAWDKWGTYISTVVNRYKDKIKYWEVWNEQNTKSFWGEDNTSNSRKYYSKMLRISYQKIKTCSSDCKVVFGGVQLEYSGYDYLTKLFTEYPDIGSYFDVFAVHPYRTADPNERLGLDSPINVMGYITTRGTFSNEIELLKRYTNKPIWFTELGCEASDNYDSEREQARRLCVFYDLGKRGGISNILWFTFAQDTNALTKGYYPVYLQRFWTNLENSNVGPSCSVIL